MAELGPTLRLLLRPAVAVALRAGVKFPELLQALKEELCAAASAELARDGHKRSVSRIAVMTGVPRRDIRRIDSGTPLPTSTVDVLTSLIGQWQTDPQFVERNVPRALTFEGTESEFFSLVKTIATDLNPYTILSELERTGSVRRKDGLLHLVAQSYEPRADYQRGWELCSADACDLVEAVAENVATPAAVPHLHIATRYDNVDRSALPTIRRWLLERGAEFHLAARNFLSQFDKDCNPALFDRVGGGRVVIGSFSRVVDAATAAPKDEDSSDE